MTISIIIPVYNEAENLPVLYRKLCDISSDIRSYKFEFVFIDDASTDDSFEIIKNMSKQDSRIRSLRFSRNFGSHIAYVAGLCYCSGSAAIAISADMQEPPEIIPRLISEWQAGHKVVWAVRETREDPKSKIAFARLYHFIMNKFALKNYPITGSDMFLIDRKVVDVVSSIREKNTTLFGLICWSGFKQGFVSYVRGSRKAGKSKWTFSKQIKLAIDSFVSFSYVPIRLSSYLGFFISSVGFLYAVFIIIQALFYKKIGSGWSSLMVVLLILSGIQLLILGILGEYLWRNLEESKKRPLFIVDEKLGFSDDMPA